MANEKSRSQIYESYIDIKVSLSLLKQNWEAYLKTEIFAFIALITFIVVISILFLLNIFFLPPDPHRFPTPNIFESRLPFTFVILLILVFYAFISSTYGLSHDIIISGDQFTEFDKSFTYFKRHFISYILLSVLILWIPITLELDFHFRNLLESNPLHEISEHEFEFIFNALSIYLLQYLFFILLNLTLPSVTSKGKILLAFKENFLILLKNPIRIVFSWGIFFVLFSLPSLFVLILLISLLGSSSAPIAGMLILILSLSGIILGYPIMSLIATRIYATTKETYEK